MEPGQARPSRVTGERTHCNPHTRNVDWEGLGREGGCERRVKLVSLECVAMPTYAEVFPIRVHPTPRLRFPPAPACSVLSH